MMWFRNSANARLREDAQLRALYVCFGVSLALHGLAMFALPGWRPEIRLDEARALTALFASRSEPAIAASESVPSKPRERVAELPVPVQKSLEPALVAEEPKAAETAAVPAPSAPAAPPSVASSAPEHIATELPAKAPPETVDMNLLEAYRLALIDAARRYKRYPAQAMERGWEGRVEIRVVVGANGKIKNALVKRSSRYQILDDQALDMVKRAFDALTQDKPAPRGREFTVDVPVIFELQTG
jgi:protein TonB